MTVLDFVPKMRWFSLLYVTISVIQVCNGLVITYLSVTRTPGYFTSSGYPSGYPSTFDESWQLTTSNGSDVINLLVMDSEIEYSTICVYDYVQVYDGPSSSSSLLRQFCGTTEPSLVSSGPSLYVTFHSDGSVSGRGFRIKYWSSEEETPEASSSQMPLIITLGVVGGCLVISLVALIYYCTTKKGRTEPRIAPTNVQPLNLGRNTRGRRNPFYYYYNTPRTPTSFNPNPCFYNNPGEALPNYRTLYPLTPPPPYSENETRAAP